MSDAEFLAALERCTLPESEFTHAAHVRAAYLYLCDGSFGQAIDRMAAAIRRYATSLGFLALIRARLSERGEGPPATGVAAANPDLLDRGLLLRHYPAQQLQSALARRVFVLPQASADS